MARRSSHSLQREHLVHLFPVLLTIGTIIFITIYTYRIFAETSIRLGQLELAVYFIPSVILMVLFAVTMKFERLGGIMLLLTSFWFLLIYHVFVSFVVFLLLVFIAVIFLLDGYHVYKHIPIKIEW